MADDRENQFLPHKKGKEKLHFFGKGKFRMELEIVGNDETMTKKPNTRNQQPPPAVTGYSSSSDSTRGDGVWPLPETQVPNLAAFLQRGWLVTDRRDRRVPATGPPAPEASAITTAVSAAPTDEQNPKRGAGDEAASDKNSQKNYEAQMDKNQVISKSKNKRIEGSNLESPVVQKLKNVDVEVEGKGKAVLEIQKNGEEKLKDERSKGSKSDQRKRKYDRRVPKEGVIMHFKYDKEDGSEIISVRNKKRSIKEVEPKAAGVIMHLKYDKEDGSEIISVRNKKRSIKEVEPKAAAADQDTKPKCKICGKFFASFQALGGHISLHNKAKSGEEGKAPAAAASGAEASHESPKRVPWFDLNELPPMEGDDEGAGDQRS